MKRGRKGGLTMVFVELILYKMAPRRYFEELTIFGQMSKICMKLTRLGPSLTICENKQDLWELGRNGPTKMIWENLSNGWATAYLLVKLTQILCILELTPIQIVCNLTQIVLFCRKWK